MLIGAHQGMGDKEINRIKEVFTSLTKKYK
jgi:hypothetical protein